MKLAKSIILPFLILLIPTLTLFAQEEEAVIFENIEGNKTCLKCHGEEFYYYYNDWIEIDVKARMNPYYIIDSASYYISNHKTFLCIDCHSMDYEDFPHSGELRMELKYTCMDCHEGDENFEAYQFEKINEEYLKSVHSATYDELFTCWMCHNPHTYKINARTSDQLRDIITYDNEICLSCHTDASKIQLLTDMDDPNIIDQHEWLPNQKLHFQHVRCIECHTDIIEDILIAHHILPKEDAVRKCEECHSRDSRLLASLYKFRAKEERSAVGFINASILDEAYIIGANRNYYLNVVSLVIFGLVLIGIIFHASLRIFK